MRKVFAGYDGPEQDAFNALLKGAFTPYRPWGDERKAKASARHHAMRAAKVAEQTDLIFDPSSEFTEIERMIMGRLAGGGAFVAQDICREWWPVIEEMEGWFAIIGLEKRGYLFRSCGHHWCLSGCGRLFLAV